MKRDVCPGWPTYSPNTVKLRKDITGKVYYTRSRYGHSFYKWIVHGKLTEEEAMAFQSLHDYAPQGYGFYGYEQHDNCTVWLCSNKC